MYSTIIRYQRVLDDLLVNVTGSNILIFAEILNSRQRRETTKEYVFGKIIGGFFSRAGSELFIWARDSGLIPFTKSFSRMFTSTNT